MEQTFDWDKDKANANRGKHRVAFDEAQTVFEDPNVKLGYDERHSEYEDRWRAIGLSHRLRLLTVAYTKRNETTIRIISARRANQTEESCYTGQV